jgi:hypothetical protein
VSLVASMAALLASADPMTVLTAGGATFVAVFTLALAAWRVLEDR